VARRKDRPGPLDPRSAAILRAIIDEYVATAQPVASQALVVKYDLGVSSATVRNVMAELERAGLLRSPHTSAGRVPTDAGYRLYVESISEAVLLAPVEQLMIRHQFGQVEFASEHWFRLAASTLAGATHSAGLATPAKPDASRLRRLDLVEAGDRRASLILVLAEGAVRQLLVLEDPRHARDRMDRRTHRHGLRAVLEQRDRETAGRRETVFRECLVPRLEHVERHDRVREQHRRRQRKQEQVIARGAELSVVHGDPTRGAPRPTSARVAPRVPVRPSAG
jgi:transcriptional regulator of heat shock response